MDILNRLNIIYSNYDLRPYLEELESLEDKLSKYKEYNLELYELRHKIEGIADKVNNPKPISHKMYDGYYKCMDCDYKTKSLNSIKAHYITYDHFHNINDTWGLKQCYCSYCDIYLDTIDLANKHINGGCPKNRICQVCNRTFANKQAREKHKCGKPKQPKYCKICDKTFATHGSYIRHFKSKHME